MLRSGMRLVVFLSILLPIAVQAAAPPFCEVLLKHHLKQNKSIRTITKNPIEYRTALGDRSTFFEDVRLVIEPTASLQTVGRALSMGQESAEAEARLRHYRQEKPGASIPLVEFLPTL